MPNTEVQSALKALRLRFNEEFELVQGTRKTQSHLFLVKRGLWSLVWTFIPKQLEERAAKPGLKGAAQLIVEALNGGNPEFAKKLEECVASARQRIDEKTSEPLNPPISRKNNDE
jgi:hypothetical protein